MNECLKNPSEKHRWAAIFQLPVAMVAILATLLYYVSPERVSALQQGYVQPLVFAATTIFLFCYHRDLKWELKLMFFFATWVVITRVLNGDHYLQAEFSSVNAVILSSFVLLPLAFILSESQRKRAMELFSVLVGSILSLIAWIAVIAAMRGKPFINPIAGNILGINGTYSGPYRLNIFDIHPNMSALLFFIAMNLMLYLICVSKHKFWYVPAAIACVGLYLAIALTLSRTVMIACSTSAALLVLLLGIRWLKLSSKAEKAIILAALMLVVAVGTYFSFSVALKAMTSIATHANTGVIEAADENVESAENVKPKQSVSMFVDTRDQAKDFQTFTGRTDIWSTFLPTLKDSPKKIFIGSAADDLIRFQEHMLGRKLVHMHNVFLQTFLYAGFPGFLMTAAFLALLLVRAVRLFFCTAPDVTIAMKIPILAVSGLLLCSMVEHCIFATSKQSSLIFFLLAGFVLADSYRYCPFKRDEREALRP